MALAAHRTAPSPDDEHPPRALDEEAASMRPTRTTCRAASAALATTIAFIATLVHAAGPSAELKDLLDQGRKSTPSAVTAAQEKYDQLRARHADDARLDYAFGIVLANQHKFREATEAFSRYLNGRKPQLSAYCLQISTLLPLRENAKALDEAGSLAQRFPKAPPAGGDEEYRDAARFLGSFFRYLELVRPDAVDTKLLSQAKDEVTTAIGERYFPAFQEGANAVARRHKDLEGQIKSQRDELTARITQRKEKDNAIAINAQAAVEASQERAQVHVEQIQNLRQQFGELQTQLVPYVRQRQTLNSAILLKKNQIKELEAMTNRNQNLEQTLRKEIQVIEREIQTLDSAYRKPWDDALHLQAAIAAHANAATFDSIAAEKNSNRGLHAERRADQAEHSLRPHAASAESKLQMFSSYVPFPYELERKRVLSWYAR